MTSCSSAASTAKAAARLRGVWNCAQSRASRNATMAAMISLRLSTVRLPSLGSLPELLRQRRLQTDVRVREARVKLERLPEGVNRPIKVSQLAECRPEVGERQDIRLELDGAAIKRNRLLGCTTRLIVIPEHDERGDVAGIKRQCAQELVFRLIEVTEFKVRLAQVAVVLRYLWENADDLLQESERAAHVPGVGELTRSLVGLFRRCQVSCSGWVELYNQELALLGAQDRRSALNVR